MKKLLSLMALVMLYVTPAMAADQCRCDDSCRKSCAEGKAEVCGCKHCDCKDCHCDYQDNKAQPHK